MTKTLPRFTRNARRPNADEVVRPLPPTLLALVAGDEAAVVHERVATSYSAARTKFASLVAAHEAALVSDESEQREAIRAGSCSEGSEGSEGRGRPRAGTA